MKFRSYSRFITLSLFVLPFLFVSGSCGFKLRTNDYRLINGGTKLYIAPVTSEIFTGGIENRLFEMLTNQANKKQGIDISTEETADLKLVAHIKQYNELTDNQVSGINTLRHTILVNVTVTDLLSKVESVHQTTVEKTLTTETAETGANEAEISGNRNKLISATAEDIISEVTASQ